LSKYEQIVILDDDPSVHQVWKSRFDSLNSSVDSIPRTHLTRLDELKKIVQASTPPERVLYLIDFELSGSTENGLDLIAKLGIANRSYLVTGRDTEVEVRNKCQSLGVGLIPKTMVAFVPIELEVRALSWTFEQMHRELWKATQNVRSF
jgi:hypothetical protein